MSEEKTLEEKIWAELRLCYDYEIPVNIVDLGLIYEVKITEFNGGRPPVETGKPRLEPSSPEATCPKAGKEVLVRMTFTSPMCPMGDLIKKDVERRVGAVPGVKKVSVEIVWDPPWDPTRMSESAKLQLGLL
jgi:metal-sulfur cluster biosynthetic enzyme